MVLSSPEFATVIATHDFDPQTMGLNKAKTRTLLVFKDDKFKVFSMPNREWWGARCVGNDNIGYIPAAYVKPADRADQEVLDKKQTDMDIAAIAAIAKEVKINARAKQTSNDKATTELGNILSARQQQGGAAPFKPKKHFQENPDNGMSSELQKLLAKRNRIIDEDEAQKEKDASEPEFLKKAVLRKRNTAPEDETEAADEIENTDNS